MRRIRGMGQKEQQRWAQRIRSGEAPPYAPAIVRANPELLPAYEAAFQDGLLGRRPSCVLSHPLYAVWYLEGWEMRTLLHEIGQEP